MIMKLWLPFTESMERFPCLMDFNFLIFTSEAAKEDKRRFHAELRRLELNNKEEEVYFLVSDLRCTSTKRYLYRLN